MRIAFKRLFRVRVRHGWYPDGDLRGDFEVVATPSTAALLAELGLRMRAHHDGLTVFGEVKPGSDPPELKRPLGAVSLRLAFELQARNTPLVNITELPAFKPARTIFCFDNLRADVVAGRLHLGDRVANVRIGAAVTLVTSGVFTYSLGTPAVAATITIRDRFGATVATVEARSTTAAETQSEYRLDLGAIPNVVPGRYDITDDRGGVSKIYYDPGLAASRPLGVIEIYSRTDGLTPDAIDRVPALYRFVTADTVTGVDTLTGLDPYYIQLEAVATTWRYLVTKKYKNNPIALANLLVSGPVAFTGTVTGDRAVFTSDATVRLSAASRGLQLRKLPGQPGQPGDEVRDLPDPDLTTPLGKVRALPNFVSDMFVYV